MVRESPQLRRGMRAARRVTVFLAAVAGASLGLASFTNVTGSVGINYLHATRDEVPTNESLGLDRSTCTVVSNHAGAAAVDVNGDGWTDFLGARYGQPPVLYVNQGNGAFEEEGLARGLGVAVDAAAFGAGDFDNDGHQDLFMVPHRGERFFLFINDGTGQFTEVAVERGAALDQSGEPHEGYSVGLVDYDRDGFLDIYVSEWGPKAPGEWGLHSVLLRNRGAEAPGFFENVTEAAGLTQEPSAASRQHGFATAWADFDGDGWPDLALIADFGTSRLYWNNGDGTFTDGTAAAGVGLDEFGMGVAVADYDNDGLLDFYVTSIFNQQLYEANGTNTGNKLYRNLGNRTFAEVSRPQAEGRVGWSWGAAFFEYDNDGDPDLVVTNGMDTFGCRDIAYEEALDDPTTVFRNDGSGRFSAIGQGSGISDTGLGKAIVVLDFDNDGDEDLVITNTFGGPVVYRSNASANGSRWLRLKLSGTVSNRDAIGAVVRVTAAGKTQTALYNPSNGYLAQREGYLHFGLGAAGETASEVSILWPSGIEQNLGEVATNQTLAVQEPELDLVPPVFLEQTESSVAPVGSSLELRVQLLGNAEAALVWEKDGEAIPGATGTSLRFKRLEPFDEGVYRVRAVNGAGASVSEPIEITVAMDPESRSVARWWNEFTLSAIRRDFPAPTIHARNLYHVSAAMWDAFWAYEPEGWKQASPVYVQETSGDIEWGGDRAAAQREAISYAAYRVLEARYRDSVGRERSLFNLRWLMQALGYDPDFLDTEGATPAAAGNRIAAGLLAAALGDGANETNSYADPSGYQAVNDPLVVKLPGTEMNDPNRWQPLALDYQVTQNGIVISDQVQAFVGSNWRDVDTFALKKPTSNTIAFDPGPPPRWGTPSQDRFVNEAVEALRYSSLLDATASEVIDISPGGLLNNPLGTNEGRGRAINPFTGKPYAPNPVKHADYGRILAEYWADGPASETPPGHWNALHNQIVDHPLFQRRYLGMGEELSPLEWDVRAYLALNGAMHDAAVAAWTLKRQYDSARPISMIRYLAGLGQSTDPGAPRYHPDGLPLVEGLIELVTEASAAPGERHEHLAEHMGELAVKSWRGEPVGGVDWIPALEWVPYQRASFVTPAFAGYVSGHSTFSRAGAEVMTLLSGSPFFPGGLGEYTFFQGAYLEHESGPSEDVVLQWATYYDAADQAGLSRLYGGIHPAADDSNGRVLGARVGVEAFLKAHALGSAAADVTGLERARIEYPALEDREATLLALAFGDGKGRPLRSAASEEAIPIEGEDAIYFYSSSAASGGATVAIESDDLRAIQFRGPVAAGETVSLRFVLRGEAPRLISMRARAEAWAPLAESGQAPAELSLYREVNDAEHLFARSGMQEASDQESIAMALSLRSGMSLQDSREARALVATVSAGSYRLELQAQAGFEAWILEIEQAR